MLAAPEEGGKTKTSTTVLSQNLSRLRVHKSSKEEDRKNKGQAAAAGEFGEKNNNAPKRNANAAAPGPAVMDRDKEKSSVEPASPEEVKLPQSFLVKYLGKRDAKGLWGIKHTRKPVDDMVTAARTLKVGTSLPFLQLAVTATGVKIAPTSKNLNPNFDSGPFSIDCISYGVQDLVYTRVFAMIVVNEASSTQSAAATATATAASTEGFKHPFECYAFVCDSRQSARRLTFSLAKAFQDFSKTVKGNPQKRKPKQFAIDIRTPEQIEEDLKNDTDSEV